MVVNSFWWMVLKKLSMLVNKCRFYRADIVALCLRRSIEQLSGTIRLVISIMPLTNHITVTLIIVGIINIHMTL